MSREVPQKYTTAHDAMFLVVAVELPIQTYPAHKRNNTTESAAVFEYWSTQILGSTKTTM